MSNSLCAHVHGKMATEGDPGASVESEKKEGEEIEVLFEFSPEKKIKEKEIEVLF